MKNNIPKDREKLIEELQEIQLKLAMTSYAEQEGNELLKENKEIKSDPFYQPSDLAKLKFKKTLNRYYKINQIKKVLPVARKILYKSVIVLVVAIVILTTSIFTVEAVRVQFLNLFIHMQENHTEFRLQNNESENILENKHYQIWKNAYAPTKIPTGFFISELINNKGLKSIEYVNEHGNIILFQQRDKDSSVNLDTENAEVIEETQINDFEGMLVVKNNLMTVIWNNNLFLFVINADQNSASIDELLNIARSVKLIN